MQPIDWQKLNQILPTENTQEDGFARKKMFLKMDNNGNRLLSMAEVDCELRKSFNSIGIQDSNPVVIRAFKAVKDKFKNSRKSGANYIEPCEFRLLLIYLKMYYEMFRVF